MRLLRLSHLPFMARLRPLSWRDLVRILRTLGFEGPFYGGKHPFMIRGALRLTIPNPRRHDISVDLLARILRQAGITADEWESADG